METLRKGVLLGFVIAGIAVLMLVGLRGWNLLVLPNLARMNEFPLYLLLGFSFLAGMVSFFAPCAFALFPGYVAIYLGSEVERYQPVQLGMMASLGVASFFILLSIIIMIFGQAVTSYLKYVAPTIGFILILLGTILFVGYSFKTQLIQSILDKLKSKEPREKRNIFLFGVGYGAVSIGCTLPLLFAMIIIPLMTGKMFHVFLSLLIYSTAMSTLMILVTYLVYWSENNLIKKMIGSTGTIKRISGLVLILIGGYTVYKNIFSSMLWR